MTTVALPFEYTTRGRQVAAAIHDAELAAVLMEDRDRQLEDWIAKVWVGGDGLRDGAIGRAKLAVDAIQSTNYDYALGPFSEAGSFFDLANGDLIMPGLFSDGATGDLDVKGSITATALEISLDGTTVDARFDDSVIGSGGAGLVFLQTPAGTPEGYAYVGTNALSDPESGFTIRQQTLLGDVDDTRGAAGLDLYTADGSTSFATLFAEGFSAGPGPQSASLQLTHNNATGVGSATLAADGIILDGQVEDDDGRSFVRSNTSLSSGVMVQAGQVTSGSTDGSGDFSVTFPEAFSSAPNVVVGPTTTTALRIYHVTNVTTSGFTVRMFNTATGNALTGLTCRFSWIALGART